MCILFHFVTEWSASRNVSHVAAAGIPVERLTDTLHNQRPINFHPTKRSYNSTNTMAAHPAKYLRHAPVSAPHVDPRLRWGAKLLGATMWFYIFYRVKEDGPVMFGQKLPFEHH